MSFMKISKLTLDKNFSPSQKNHKHKLLKNHLAIQKNPLSIGKIKKNVKKNLKK